MSMVAMFVLIDFPQFLCFTSTLDDEETWALTSCPDPPRKVTEMTRVSLQYQELWSQYNN